MSITRTLTRRGRLGAGLRHRSARRRPRITPRMRLAALVSLVMAGVLFGAWMWVRDSSLVGVDQVTITGVSGADAPAIRSALRSAARNMTTLDVQMAHLRTAVAPFPDVKRLEVKTAFPHRLVIAVIEQRPVGLIDAGGRQMPVAADGTILRSVPVSTTLPTIPVTVPPVGSRLREGRAAEAVALLAAAPYQLLSKISQVTTVAGHGLVAQLRNGPSLYFGDTTRLSAKWTAATEVLADQGSAGASYIDVTDPARPAAGAGSGSGSASSTDSTGTSTASPSDTSATAAASGATPTTGSSGATPGG
jgi:cell division protein FtsQ